jgi:Ulp1 family protease
LQRYFSLIEDRSRARDDLPMVWCISSLQYTTFENKKYNPNVMKKNLKGDFDKLKFILVPVNVNRNHWYCGMVDIDNKNIAVYDSLVSKTPRNFYTIMKDYLNAEWERLKLSAVEWTQTDVTCPQQDNTNDCGVFTIRFAEVLSRGGKVTDVIQRKMENYRKITATELLQKALD